MKYRLRELEAELLKLQSDGTVDQKITRVEDADGICFLCPKCFEINKGNVGTHSVLCWFEGKVPDDLKPGSGRWKPAGETIDDLTFIPGLHSPSVQLTSQWSGAHFHVVDGGTQP